MAREGEAPTSKDLVASAREQLAREAGSSDAMVAAARRQSREGQASAGPGLSSVTVVGEGKGQVVEAPVGDASGYRPDVDVSWTSGRQGPSPLQTPQPVPAPASERDRTTARGVRRLIALVVVGFVVFSVLNSNFDGIRNFVEEQLDGSATSDGPQVEGTDAPLDEAQGAADLGGPPVDSVEFAEFPLPAGATPLGIAVGFDAVWYLDSHPNNKVGKLELATGELVAQYVSPEPGLHGAIAIGFDAVWFAPERVDGEAAEVIFRLDPAAGTLSRFPLPTDSGPSRITTGLGYVWYTALSHNAIGRLHPVTGDVVEYPIPTPGSLPVGITTGFGAVWFTEVSEDARKIGRLDLITGEITEYPMLSQAGAQCCGVATGFDAVWYTASDGNVIGRLDPMDGTVIEYALPNPGSRPLEIVAGPDAVWFTENSGNRIGRLDPGTGTITEYRIPRSNSGPFGIAEGSIWFSASSGGSIGRLDP